MAEPKENALMEKIVSLCKRRGFIFQSSEIYGGINGFWDYGPLGADLKRNVKDYWWRSMTQLREDIAGLDATIIMHPTVWKASGHVDTFADPMVDCKGCKKRFRADQIEAASGTVFHYTGAREGSFLDTLVEEFKPGADIVSTIKSELTLSLAQAQIDRQGVERSIKEFLLHTEDETNRELAEKIIGIFQKMSVSEEHFSALAPEGGKPDKARKLAKQFYQSRGVVNPVLVNEREEKVTNTTGYCNECGGQLMPPRQFNLMFKTYVGPVESEENVAYLRPETAQAIFAQFKNVLETSRQRVPFGICQIGKAFRNEINPRNFTFRSREFEQMEIEYFIRPDEVVEKVAGRVARLADNPDLSTPRADWGWEVWHKHWVEERIRWYESIGLPRSSLGEYWQKQEELAHYAKACVDILFKFPFGTQELEGIAARGDFDLSQHQKHSGKSMEYFDEEAKTKYVPHVIEPSAGVDRLVLALICNAYCEDQAPNEKGEMETRVVMRFHPRIAPIKAAVFPLLKNKPDLVAKAKEVRDLLRPHMSVFYDETGAIGRRYRRQDEAGTPYCLTIDFDTLGEKGPELKDTVTLRDRDTLKQERVKISELPALLLSRIR